MSGDGGGYGPLSEPEKQVALSKLLGVFRSPDPYDCTVSAEGLGLVLGYPFMYDLDDHEYAVLFEAASRVNERNAYVSIVEGYQVPELLQSPLHWRIDLSSYPYPALSATGWPHIGENAIYSTAGTWALKLSACGHMVAAGPMEFIQALRVLGQFSPTRMEDLVREWPDSSPVHWIQPCLVKVFGEVEAGEILARARSSAT